MTVLKRKKHFLIPVYVFMFLCLIFYCLADRALAGQKAAVAEGKKLYMHYCTPCHGIKGDGKGFNSVNLDPRAANHTDAGIMNKRTDNDLHEVITGGGRAAGKSTLMPPWGDTVSEAQIKSLIIYLRKLCKCQGL